MNLRKQITEDLEFTMENIEEYGLPIELIGPQGKQTLKKDSTDKLTGQVLYNTTEFNPDTGEDIVLQDPIAVLRLDSLIVEPQNGEKWIVRIPERPDPDAPLVDYALTPTKAMKFNRSIGFVRIYLSRIKQS